MLELAYEVKLPDTALVRGEQDLVVSEELRAATEHGVHLLQGAIVPETPINRGTLRAGVQTSLAGNGVSLVGRVFNPLTYARPVEMGRRPGKFPPPDAILLWVQSKFGMSGGAARSMAFLVARKIAQRGIKAVNMFSRAVASQRGAIQARFRQAGAVIARRLGS